MLEEKKNYYEVLEIPIGCAQSDIDRAYQRARNSYTQDNLALYSLLSEDECKEILEQVEEAYSILGEPDKRREYDRVRGLNTIRESNTSNFALPQFKENADSELSNGSSASPNRSINKLDNAHVSKIQAYNRYSLNYEENAEFEQKIEIATEFTGEFLRQIREYKKVTPDRMAEITKISKSYLKYIEDEDFHKLPAEVFVRGFILQIAKCLKLNPDLVSSSFIQRYRRGKSSIK